LRVIARVGVRRASDVGSGEKDDTNVVFSETKVEGAGAFVVGCFERGDGDAERGHERLAELGDGVDEAVEGEELWASNIVGHLRLAKSDLNVGEAGLTEDSLDGVGGSHRIVEVQSLVLHADPHQERAKQQLLPGVGEGDGVDRGPLNAARVEELGDVRTNLEPGACDSVAVDRARLADVALRLRTLAFRPGRA
jgi:hypothetical protein